jgi:hypothetical protein
MRKQHVFQMPDRQERQPQALRVVASQRPDGAAVFAFATASIRNFPVLHSPVPDLLV